MHAEPFGTTALDIVIKPLIQKKQKISDLLNSIMNEIAQTKAQLIEDRYLSKLKASEGMKLRLHELNLRERLLLKQYENSLLDMETTRYTYHNELRRAIEDIIASGHVVSSNYSLVQKEISHANLQKNITVLIAKLTIAQNRKKIESSKNKDYEIVDLKIKNLKNAIKAAEKKLGLIDREISDVAHAEKLRIQKKHSSMLNDMIIHSKDNIRQSKIIDISAHETSNFTVPELNLKVTEDSECGTLLNITCGAGCCPKEFPICGGTLDCPVGKCCSKISGPSKLINKYVNVSTFYGIELIKPLLDYKNISKIAYTSKIHKIIQDLQLALKLLKEAEVANELAQRSNGNSIRNIQAGIKKEGIAVNRYKNTSIIYRRQITAELAMSKGEFKKSMDVFAKIAAMSSTKNITSLKRLFFDYRNRLSHRIHTLASVLKKNRFVEILLNKIKLLGQQHYIDDVNGVSQNVINNGKEIGNAVKSVRNNLDMFQELERDAKKWYEDAART
jgi:hypothetical protein